MVKSFDLGGNRTHDLRIRSTVTLPTELRGRTEKVGDDLGWWSKLHFNLHFRVNSLFHHLCSHVLIVLQLFFLASWKIQTLKKFNPGFKTS